MPGYQVREIEHAVGGHPYRLRVLVDTLQFSDPDGHAERAGISSATWSLFGQLWPAGALLAHAMDRFDIEGKRILELGCGIGLASLVLLIYVARFFARHEGERITFRESILPLLLPVIITCGLVLPANLSTALIIFVLANGIMFVGGYPFVNLLKLWGLGVAGLGLFILVVMAFPDISNRVDTWKSRIESFTSGDSEESYQVEKAKMAIAQGGLLGKGPGKSV